MPVSPPQPAGKFGPVDQLTTPMIASLPFVVAKSRRAGIASAGAKAGSFSFGRRIEQADLQRTWVAGDDERCRAHHAVGAVGAAHGDAIAGNHERVADGDCFVFAGDAAGGIRVGSGSASLSSATSAVARWANSLLRSNCGSRSIRDDVFEHRPLSGLAVGELVIGAGLHAMRRREQKVARDRGRGANGSVRADNHHDGASGAVGRRRRAADHRRGRRQRPLPLASAASAPQRIICVHAGCAIVGSSFILLLRIAMFSRLLRHPPLNRPFRPGSRRRA